MPQLDGVSAARLIRESDKNTPIVCLASDTKQSDLGVYERAGRSLPSHQCPLTDVVLSGMTSILAKPFGYKKVFASMKEHGPFAQEPQWTLPKDRRPKGKRVERNKAAHESTRTPGQDAPRTPQIQAGGVSGILPDTALPHPEIVGSTARIDDDDVNMPSPCDAPLRIDLEFLLGDEDISNQAKEDDQATLSSVILNRGQDDEMEVEYTFHPDPAGEPQPMEVNSIQQETRELPTESNLRSPIAYDQLQSLEDQNRFDDLGIGTNIDAQHLFPTNTGQNIVGLHKSSVMGPSKVCLVFTARPSR